MSIHEALLRPNEETDLRQERRRNWILLGILVIAIVLYVWKFNSFQVGVYMDDAEYIVLAESIVFGPNYGLINGPDDVQPTRYPFGWPLVLAPVYFLSGGSFQALKLVSFLATLANIIMIALLWRWLGLRKAWIGLGTSAVYAFLPMTVGHAGMVMSEAAFLTAVLICLSLTTYLGLSTKPRSVVPLVLGIFWVFAAFTRSIGVTTVTACLIFLAWRQRWRILLLSVVGFAVTLILIIGITPIAVTDVINVSEYQSQFSDPGAWGLANTNASIVSRALEGVDHYTRQFLRDAMIPFIGGPSTAAIFTSLGMGWVLDTIGLLLTALTVIGYIVTLRGGFHPAHIFVPAYLAVLVVWPWQGDRFLYGVLPYLIAYTLLAGMIFLMWLDQRAADFFSSQQRWIYYVGVVLLFIWLSTLAVRSTMIDSSMEHTPDQQAGTPWLENQSPSDSVVAAGQPLSVYLYSRRTTMPLTNDLQTIRAAACRYPLFVLIAPKLEWRNDDFQTADVAALDMIAAARSVGASTEVVYSSPREAVQIVRIIGLCDQGSFSRESLALAY